MKSITKPAVLPPTIKGASAHRFLRAMFAAPALCLVVIFSPCTAKADAEALYVPEGWLYNFDYTGTAQNTAGPAGGRTIDPTAAGTINGILDRSESPEGGNFVVGVYQGTQNWVNYFYAGIPLSSLIHEDGSLASLVDGASYTANFWMRGNELNDLLSGAHAAYMFDSNVPIRILDAPSSGVALESYTATIGFAANGWTEVALPFTYNASTMSTAALSASIVRATTDWDYTTGAAISNVLAPNRLGATGFDFVQADPVPEPTSAFMMALTGAFLCLRRPSGRRGGKIQPFS